MEVTYESIQENILPHFSNLFSHRTPGSAIPRTGTDRWIQKCPGRIKATPHLTHYACYRSGRIQAWTYQTFAKRTFKI